MARYVNQPLSIGQADGEVTVALHDTPLLSFSPENARKFADALYIKAAHAEGKEAPQVVTLASN